MNTPTVSVQLEALADSARRRRACLRSVNMETRISDDLIRELRRVGVSWTRIAAAAGEAEPTLRIRYQRRRGAVR